MHCFYAGSSLPLLDNLYTFDLAGYLSWFRPSDSIAVKRNLTMALQPSNKAKIDHDIRPHIMEDTALHAPSIENYISSTSKNGRNSTFFMNMVAPISNPRIWTPKLMS